MIDISVIMPVYNAEKFLAEAIESILKQSFNNFEFIIINDGSTDASEFIIKKFLSDNRIVFINRQDNKKLVYTLNEGIKKSSGRYIARMDADDISFSERLEKQFLFLEENKNIQLIGTSYISFNKTGINQIHTHPKSPVEIAYRFVSNTYFCHPSVMFRSELLKEFGNYDNVEAEDFKFFSKIVSKYPCANIMSPLLYYREHDNNRSVTHKKELEFSVENNTRNNISIYFKSSKLQTIYYEYRLHINRNSKQILFSFILDIFVIFKICLKYRRVKYYLQGMYLIMKLLKNNSIMGVNKIKRLWN